MVSIFSMSASSGGGVIVGGVIVSVSAPSGGDLLSMGEGNLYGSTWGVACGCG